MDPVLDPVLTTTTSTVVSNDAVIEAAGKVLSALMAGDVLGTLTALFMLVILVVNFGPVASWLASLNGWIRPLIMFVGIAGAAGLAAAAKGQDVVTSILAGVSAGVASGMIQLIVQRVRK